MAARSSVGASSHQAGEDSSSAAAKALLLERYVHQQVHPYLAANANAARALAALQQLPVRASPVAHACVAGHRASSCAAERRRRRADAWCALPQGAEIALDHFAFRSWGTHGLGLDAAARVWTDLGYERRDLLLFPGKKLKAYWCVS
jgi:hypothetical protein